MARPKRSLTRGALASGAVLALLVAGCGDDSSGGATATRSTPARTSAATGQLMKPIKPRCGVAQFPAPVIQKSDRNGVTSWTLRYMLGPKAPQIAGASSQVTITELPPGKESTLGRSVRIAGRSVRFVPKSARSPFSFGTWVTSQAKYIVLDDAAGARTLRKLVGCLP
jgi:hypothetical protein